MRKMNRQEGFTLIELIAVIAILGTLSAYALPKFASLGRDARKAKIDAARGAMVTGIRTFHMKWILAGSPAAASTIDGVQMNGSGYPTNAGVIVASGVSDDYDTHVAGTIATDPDHPNCSVAYSSNTGDTIMNYSSGLNC